MRKTSLTKPRVYVLVLLLCGVFLSTSVFAGKSNVPANDMLVVDLIVKTDVPILCRVDTEWKLEPSLALEGKWFADEGFRNAQVLVLVGLNDGERIVRHDVIFLKDKRGEIIVLHPCTGTHELTLHLSSLYPRALWINSEKGSKDVRWIHVGDELLAKTDGYFIAHRGTISKENVLGFEIIP